MPEPTLTKEELNSSVELTDEAWLENDDEDENRRPLLTWAEFSQRQRRNKRCDNYDLVFEPREDGEWRVNFAKLRRTRQMAPDAPLRLRQQATKWLKWYGQGWRPLGYGDAPIAANEVPSADELAAEMPMLYWCKDGARHGEGLDNRPECDRFFDSAKALRMHQASQHGGADKLVAVG